MSFYFSYFMYSSSLLKPGTYIAHNATWPLSVQLRIYNVIYNNNNNVASSQQPCSWPEEGATEVWSGHFCVTPHPQIIFLPFRLVLSLPTYFRDFPLEPQRPFYFWFPNMQHYPQTPVNRLCIEKCIEENVIKFLESPFVYLLTFI